MKNELKLLCYNVAGLPIPKVFSPDKRSALKDSRVTASLLAKSDYDVIAVQEDFQYHAIYEKTMPHPYRTRTSGGVPAGDGLNLFSHVPFYNVERRSWNKTFGVLDALSDELTPKGILRCVLEPDKNRFVDLYVIHTDAGDDDGSIAARRSNFRQLAKYIQMTSPAGRAIIVTGDFNARLTDEEQNGMREILLDPLGMTDVWTQLKNGGDKNVNVPGDREKWWGVADSIERVFYRSGSEVTLEPTEHEYIFYRAQDGHSLSDHAGVTASFKVTGCEKQRPAMLKSDYVPQVKSAYVRGFAVDLRLIAKDIKRIIGERFEKNG